uniref:Uncharacterized protein n=1 Tax=Oryza glumipatula TaxID=40148 RepID=A0A0E0AWS2_9ORYZ
MDQEASLLPAASSHTVVRRKRALQLNETVYEEPEYVATKGGTYNVAEMPERFKSPNNVDGQDAWTTAMFVRGMILLDASFRELQSRIASEKMPSMFVIEALFQNAH